MAGVAQDALVTAMQALTGSAQPLDGWQVTDSYPIAGITFKCIYLGGYRFIHTDEAGEVNLVGSEIVTIGVYFRAVRPDGTVKAARNDTLAAADAVCALFNADPDMGGNMTWMGVSQGSGDYSETPSGPEAVLSLQVMVGAVLV
jgi:hypothetical protein